MVAVLVANVNWSKVKVNLFSLSLSLSLSLTLSYPKEPEDVVLFLSEPSSISGSRDGIAKQPESKRTSKYVNVFLDKCTCTQ